MASMYLDVKFNVINFVGLFINFLFLSFSCKHICLLGSNLAISGFASNAVWHVFLRKKERLENKEELKIYWTEEKRK